MSEATVHRLRVETPFGTTVDWDCPFCLYDEAGRVPTAGMCDGCFDQRFPSKEAAMLGKAHVEQIEYYRLCADATKAGIPVSLDDPRSPKTVPALREAVRAAA